MKSLNPANGKGAIKCCLLHALLDKGRASALGNDSKQQQGCDMGLAGKLREMRTHRWSSLDLFVNTTPNYWPGVLQHGLASSCAPSLGWTLNWVSRLPALGGGQ